ncbi:MAG TPA: TIGR04282 family arsenosugar biosynthesis glycosyltransferase [Thermoanaerobaculia bacterium]|nr:TIGR04282 family arsenosugar biosynthesis glycosyltransferase [Thermoanaerobaculia bacterium]
MHRTIPPPRQRLLIFARLPELGNVKTRLAQTIGAERALAVYRAMLRDVLASVGPSSEETEVEVMWAPSAAANAETLRDAFGSANLAMQTGSTLGDRLAMAFSERFFFHRTEKIIAIGVDDPRLPRETIEHAFAILDSCDWTVGPAADGGYYLIGCRAAAFDSSVFDNIEWGTNTVFRATMERIGERGTTVAVLPERADIDIEDDLARFANDPGEGELARLLREWG